MDGSYDTSAPAAECGPPPAAGPRRRHGGGEAGQGEAARARRVAGVWRAGRGVQGQLVIVAVIRVVFVIILELIVLVKFFFANVIYETSPTAADLSASVDGFASVVAPAPLTSLYTADIHWLGGARFRLCWRCWSGGTVALIFPPKLVGLSHTYESNGV